MGAHRVFSGTKVLVTGASGGIGAAIARDLHRNGAIVAISGTREERLKELADELGERVHVLPCDLNDRAAVTKLAVPSVQWLTIDGLSILCRRPSIRRSK